jgi:hypothetical protein
MNLKRNVQNIGAGGSNQYKLSPLNDVLIIYLLDVLIWTDIQITARFSILLAIFTH